jgi:hypothetical protein
MSNVALCDGDLLLDPAGFMACSGSWSVVPYVEPTDSSLVYAQLVALNEFDPEKAGLIIVSCLATFVVGFGAGVVIKLLRRL